jgi:hypothetical protein
VKDFRFSIFDFRFRGANAPVASIASLINSSLQRGGSVAREALNRFSGIHFGVVQKQLLILR